MMPQDEIKTIGVIGAGQMGRGITHVCAAAGYRVLLTDVAEPVLEDALKKILTGIERAVERGNLSSDEARLVAARIHPNAAFDSQREADLVIEAVPEVLALKTDVFMQLGRIVPPATILASNTSSISITTLGAASGRPDRVVGLHFMNPAPVMQLVEVIRGRETSDKTMDRALEVVTKLGKVSVVSKDAPGFIVNRVLMPMINEAIFALEEGVASAEAIDRAMTAGTNQPVGPLALADRIGLDTVLAICEVLHQDLHDSKFRPCALLRRYVEMGRLGKKSGRGFYVHSEADAQKAAHAESADIRT
ncbi:MAG TPA: 3-hydroxyacyl-CoA dehydrogenase NAD-binding domain-containing protein [Nitrospiraceae bacterium]|nr:3-hydroxyacyl-CoA dehydrogenase NAD-binding domain-containing protein [Nitrospiraceae bacterium]